MGPYNYFDFIWENYAYPDNLSMLGQVSGYRRSPENYSSFHVLYWWIDFEKFVNVMLFNPNWHELWKYEKCSYLALSRSKFYKTHWAWQGVKLSRLNSIFTSIVVLKFLIKIQLTKSNAKIKRGINPPCPMPIRVNVDSLALSGAPTFLMHFYPKIK